MNYTVKAVGDRNQIVSLTIAAADEAAARDVAKTQGFSVLTIRPAGGWLGQALGSRRKFPTTLFSQELLALLEAGLSLVEVLEVLTEKEQRPENHRVLDSILTSIYHGQTFSNAISQFPQCFAPLYIAAVRSSEKTGNLQQALGRYIEYREQLDRIRKKIVASAIYPTLLFAVGGLVMMFLMFYVVPRFSRVYEDLSTELPFFSQILLVTGRALDEHGGIALLALASLVTLAAYYLGQARVRNRLLAQAWRIPGLGNKIRVYELSRLYRTLGMLLRGGIPVTQATDMVSGLLSAESQVGLAQANRLMKEGLSISTAMRQAGLATPIAERLLVVGERTGNMGEMMDRIASFFDEELARWVEWFTRLFEPILMAVIGLVIGLIVVLMYMPIFELAGSVR